MVALFSLAVYGIQWSRIGCMGFAQSRINQYHSHPSSTLGTNVRSRNTIPLGPLYGVVPGRPLGPLYGVVPGPDTTGPKSESISKNEFSRTVQFFGEGVRRKRQIDLSISAAEAERQALATRFRLTDIASLSADLTLQPALGLSTAGDESYIEAIGKVSAQVTQTCVRTNEEFQVDLEFHFNTVLKAMSSSRRGSSTDELSAGELQALESAFNLDTQGRSKRKGGKKPRGVKGVRGGQSSRDLDDMGMKQLRDKLQEYEITDEIIEDEACFCTDGIVDVGEIVAQIFRSKLDPYPKKPGSDPVSYSFTF